jgi:hypothetical protein
MTDKKGGVYFHYIQSFWIAQQRFGLSAGSVSFYFYLLNCFNAARWPERLGISSMEVQGILGISKKTLYNFKAELSEINAINADFQTGRIRQNYSLNWPTVTPYEVTYGDKDGEVDRVVDREADRVVDRVVDGAKFTPTLYIDKDEDKDSPPKSPPKGAKDDETEKAAEAIYEAYPRKVGKPVALRAIKRHLRKFGAEELLAKTKAYAEAVKDSDHQFIPHPSTFFNQERFNDDPQSWSTPQGSVVTKGNVYHWIQREKELKEKMRTYKNAHRSEMAMGYEWDPGTREKYNQMAKELEELRMTLDELN